MAEARSEKQVPLPGPPTSLARRFVRYLVGFGVSVGLGLAPFLGQLDLPLFTPLLHMIPGSLRDTLLPTSAALMGLVAVVVQWLGEERLTKAWLRKMFGRALTVAGACLLLLLILERFLVVRIPVERTGTIETFVVGFVKPDACRGLSRSECVKGSTLDEGVIAASWGDGQIALASLSLELVYLLFTGAFAALIGLLVLRPPAKSTAQTSAVRPVQPARHS